MALATAIGMSVEDAGRWPVRSVAGFEAAVASWLSAEPAPAILHAFAEHCPVTAGTDVPPGLFLTAASLAMTRPDCPIAAVPGLRTELYRPVLAAIDARIPVEPIAEAAPAPADQASKPPRRVRQGPPAPVPVIDTGRRGTPYPMRRTYPRLRKAAPTRAATFDWTEERVALLTELWKREVRMSEIQRQLGGGITRNAIAGKLHRLKLFGDSRGGTA